jgi:hypothetical protein
VKSTSRFVLILGAAVVAVAAVYFFRRERLPAPVRVDGQTIGADGAPIGGVNVVLEVSPSDTEEEMAVERVETVSDEKGGFSINYQGRWRHATYRLEARKPGYEELSIDDADTMKRPISLRLTKTPS